MDSLSKLSRDIVNKFFVRSVLRKIKPGVYEFIASNGDIYLAKSTAKDKKHNFDISRNGKMIDNGAYKVSDIRPTIALEIRNVRRGLL